MKNLYETINAVIQSMRAKLSTKRHVSAGELESTLAQAIAHDMQRNAFFGTTTGS